MFTNRLVPLWLIGVTLATLLTGMIYVAVQQDYRQSANDPQIQFVEDAASQLAAGQTPEAILPYNSVDIADSLAPYLTVFNETGKPIAGSGKLDGTLPTL